jgi:hypothetical protein
LEVDGYDMGAAQCKTDCLACGLDYAGYFMAAAHPVGYFHIAEA